MNPLYITCLVVTGISALCVVGLVMIHSPKGEGLGGIGGTATIFTGKRGAEAGLDRLTWGFVLVFMVLCLILGFGFISP